MLHPGLSKAFDQRWQKFKKELKNCRNHPSSDAVHNLRVAIRRLTAILSVIEVFIPGKNLVKCKKEFKILMQPFGRLRDTHVEIQWIEKLFSRIGPGLNEYLKNLSTKKARLEKKVIKIVASFKPRYSKKVAATCLAEFPGLAQNGVNSEEFEKFADTLLTERFFNFIGFEKDVLDPANVSALHEMRIVFKNYRYTVEVLYPILVSDQTDLTERMHNFQTILGELHDFDMLAQKLAMFSNKKKRTKYEIANLKTAQRKLRQVRAQYFDRFIKEFAAAKTDFAPMTWLPAKSALNEKKTA